MQGNNTFGVFLQPQAKERELFHTCKMLFINTLSIPYKITARRSKNIARLFILFFLMQIVNKVDGQKRTFGPGETNDTIRLKELENYVIGHYFSKTLHVELYASQAIELAKKLNERSSLAELYRMMGIIQYFNGEYDAALANYLDAVALFKELGNVKGEADTYNEIGNVYRKHNRLKEARDILAKAYALSRSIRDTSGMAKAYNNSGIVAETDNDLKTALRNYEAALVLYEKINDSIGQSYCYENIGGIHMMQKNYHEAETYFQKSLALRQAARLEQAVAMSYHYLGELYQKKGDLQASRDMYYACLAIARRIHYPDMAQKALFSIASNYRQAGDFTKAYDYFEQASILKDSLFNAEKSRQLAELQTRFEVDNQRQENLLLQQSNELNRQAIKNRNLVIFIVIFAFAVLITIALLIYKRRQQHMAVLTQLRIQKAERLQRVRISHDLHDHVGAQLSYVVSNLDIANQEIKGRHLEPKRLEAITEMSKQAISTLRETVWALNNESISVESFADKFKVYARKMTDLSTVKLEFHEDIQRNALLSPNAALHLFRICQEAFTNALKHSECTLICISVRSGADIPFEFELSDNGKGFDPEEAGSKGHYGLKNMKHRAEEVGAVYTLSTHLGKGTVISLRLKENTTYA